MRRRDTTLLLSSRLAAALVLILLSITASAQSSGAGDAFPSGIPEKSAIPAKAASAAKAANEAAPPPQDPQASPPPAPTQQPAAQEEQGGFVFHKQVEEVVLHATVVDDGKPQTIVSFRHEDIPVAMGIVIDNSGSMREKRDKVNKAAINLVKSSNPQDEVFIVNFNDEYYLDQDFTNDITKLKEALEKVDTRGGTALYDAVVASADHLKK